MGQKQMEKKEIKNEAEINKNGNRKKCRKKQLNQC